VDNVIRVLLKCAETERLRCQLLSSEWLKFNEVAYRRMVGCSKGKAVPRDAMEALGGRGGIAPTHSRPRH
jgi:hypothetical protein